MQVIDILLQAGPTEKQRYFLILNIIPFASKWREHCQTRTLSQNERTYYRYTDTVRFGLHISAYNVVSLS